MESQEQCDFSGCYTRTDATSTVAYCRNISITLIDAAGKPQKERTCVVALSWPVCLH